MRKFLAIAFTGAAIVASLAGPAQAGKSPAPDGNCGKNQVTFENGLSPQGKGFNTQDCTAHTPSSG